MFANCPNYVGSLNVPHFVNEEREVFIVTWGQVNGRPLECTFETREEAQANADYYAAQGIPTTISQRRECARVEVSW